jgi:hypothetical protein
MFDERLMGAPVVTGGGGIGAYQAPQPASTDRMHRYSFTDAAFQIHHNGGRSPTPPQVSNLPHADNQRYPRETAGGRRNLS